MPARYRTSPRSDAERRQRAGFNVWLSVFECAAEAWATAAEHETCMYATELAEYREAHPPPTLKAYMVDTAGQRRC